MYKTVEEAERELEKYDEHNIRLNEEYNDEHHRCKEGISDRLNELKNQKRYFVVELMASPNKYLFSATSFPFIGENGVRKNVPTLVQGVKDVVKRRNNTYPTIEVVLYTLLRPPVENLDERDEWAGARSLNQQEKQEFVRLYGSK